MAALECFINAAQGNTYGRATKRFNHLADKTTRHANFLTFPVIQRFKGFASGVQDGRVGRVNTDDLDALEFVIEQVFLRILHDRGALRRRQAGIHEGQLNAFKTRKASWRKARDGPDNVDHTVFELLRQIRGFTAQLHIGVDLNLELSTRLFHHLFSPGVEVFGLIKCLRRAEGMDTQRRLSADGETGGHERPGQNKFTNHGVDLPGMYGCARTKRRACL